MPEKKNERIKIYITIGLALIMAVLCYFRFIHKKGTRDEKKIPYNPSVAELDVPKVKTKMMKTNYWRKQPQDESLPKLERDIFVNVNSLNNAKNEFLKSSSEKTESGIVTIRSPQLDPGLELTGTIVGGENPIAIINDQFVRVGDLIDEYKLVSIKKEEVILDMDGRTIKVEMLQNE